ncbi:MAG: hypothetical protein ACRDNS_11980, partial [Trebonia sp.]
APEPAAAVPDQMTAWAHRPAGVAYIGGTSDEQAASILADAARRLSAAGIPLHIAGDGPAAGAVRAVAETLPGVYFHGLVQRTDRLGAILGRCRVGLALYDPDFPMFHFVDSLKTKDYLAAGLRVVTTLPGASSDEAVVATDFTAASVLDGVHRALYGDPFEAMSEHPSLLEAAGQLGDFVRALEARA